MVIVFFLREFFFFRRLDWGVQQYRLVSVLEVLLFDLVNTRPEIAVLSSILFLLF